MQGVNPASQISRAVPAISFATLLAACTTGATLSPPVATLSPQATATASASPSLPEGVVAVSLSEMDMLVSSDTAPAGEVTFVVRNAGELPHELVVIRTNKDAAELPVEDVKVVERRLDIIARTDHIAAGDEATLTAGLDAGHYVLICNLSGHYEQSQFGPGMRANFDVE
jgi:uncharacterized cupredoxin-like copper-binding protein